MNFDWAIFSKKNLILYPAPKMYLKRVKWPKKPKNRVFFLFLEIHLLLFAENLQNVATYYCAAKKKFYLFFFALKFIFALSKFLLLFFGWFFVFTLEFLFIYFFTVNFFCGWIFFTLNFILFFIFFFELQIFVCAYGGLH